ncbi:glycosyltransferase family 2 protein [Olivibacter sp. CPCC 100613]|uniref:glycosyltransferase family 2 protein n=1 Tax=Olivibacter sp. CPCC 100613 TaxID=3079931 RepID=UPI002FFCCC26
MNPFISVIVPVYNVQQFIECTAHHLFQQDLKEIEYIFVDDCSPDNSILLLHAVLEQYPERQAYTTIIRHEQNKGLPAARNTGLQRATGQFIFHCDGDDWIEKDALSKLYTKASHDGSDVVWCDWYLSFKDTERYMSQAPEQSDILTGRQCVELMLGGKLRFNVWNKLVKRSLYEQAGIRFPEGYPMGEDMTMIQVLAMAFKVSYLPQALYHYVQINTEAYTKKKNDQHLKQIRHNVDQTIAFLRQHYGASMDQHIQFFKLNTKLPFLISSDTQSYQHWLEWYPEANPYIGQNPMFNMRIRLIQYAALKKQYWLLRLYYGVIIKMVYGVIYR